MAMTVKVSIRLYELINEAENQADDGDLTDAMAARIIRTVRELELNFNGRKTGD